MDNDWQSYKACAQFVINELKHSKQPILSCFPAEFLPLFPELSQKCHLALIRSEKPALFTSAALQRYRLMSDHVWLRVEAVGPQGSMQTDGKEDGVGHWDGRAATGGLKAAVLLIDTRDRALRRRAESQTKGKEIFCSETIPWWF